MRFSDYELERIRGTGVIRDMKVLFNNNYLWTELYDEVDDPGLTEWELFFKEKKKPYHFVEAVEKKTGKALYCILTEKASYGKNCNSKIESTKSRNKTRKMETEF